jgi:thiol-disulfide isomerase/thioredoxin
MDNCRKYLKYKTKYLKYKSKLNNKINLIGGSEPIFYFGHDNKDYIKKYKITIYLFKADWCGHCKNFKDIWNEVAKIFTDTHSDKINFIVYDSKLNEEELKRWNVKGFPTIFIRKNTDAYEYNGNRQIDEFKKYIEGLLEQE